MTDDTERAPSQEVVTRDQVVEAITALRDRLCTNDKGEIDDQWMAYFSIDNPAFDTLMLIWNPLDQIDFESRDPMALPPHAHISGLKFNQVFNLTFKEDGSIGYHAMEYVEEPQDESGYSRGLELEEYDETFDSFGAMPIRLQEIVRAAMQIMPTLQESDLDRKRSG